MYSIGPGRKSEMAATMCSNLVGCMSINMRRIPAPSTWNTPATSPRASSSNACGSSIGNVFQVELDAVILLDEVARAAHDGQRAQAEKVHLEQADGLARVHLELRDDAQAGFVRAFGGAVQRRVLDQRPIGDDDARRVRAGVACHALQLLRRVEQLRGCNRWTCTFASAPAPARSLRQSRPACRGWRG